MPTCNVVLRPVFELGSLVCQATMEGRQHEKPATGTSGKVFLWKVKFGSHVSAIASAGGHANRDAWLHFIGPGRPGGGG